MNLLDQVKVGSNVFHITKGWGVVSEILDGANNVNKTEE